MIERFRSWRIHLVAGVVAFFPVYLSYLQTHPYPALGGGLYLMMGDVIAANGYGLPAVVPHYTSGGIPFGYPPFMLALLGMLLDLGVSPIVLTRFLPGILVAGALIVYASAATEILQSPRQGAFAAIVIATSPPVLRFTLTAGGTVRAAALLFTAGGIYTGARLFRSGEWQWLLASAGLFGLTIQTHPLYTVFFATSYLALFVGIDRTPAGFIRGGVVAAGGLALSAPWLFSVARTHSLSLFLRASNTHGGIGYPDWHQQFLHLATTSPTLWPALAIAGGLFLLLLGRPLLPIWFVGTGFLTGRDEYLLIVGAMMISVVLFEGVVPLLRAVESVVEDWIKRRWNAEAMRSVPDRITARFGASGPRLCVLAIVVLGTITTYGTTSASMYVDGGEADDALSMFVHGADENAAEWVRTNTDKNASFVVIGDFAEWFPLLTHRTNLVVPQGSEWEGERGKQHHYRSQLRHCSNATCLTSWLNETGLSPRYIYLSRAGYNTPRSEHRWNRLGSSLHRSNEYEVVFKNRGVLIARRT